MAAGPVDVGAVVVGAVVVGAVDVAAVVVGAVVVGAVVLGAASPQPTKIEPITSKINKGIKNSFFNFHLLLVNFLINHPYLINHL